ncbi:hypothetical protein HKX48_003669 [Thoreauomyces humboldtii]|nr:hypothetical protein HKX48_003669 [Thoreauomyces humboldtii]
MRPVNSATTSSEQCASPKALRANMATTLVDRNVEKLADASKVIDGHAIAPKKPPRGVSDLAAALLPMLPQRLPLDPALLSENGGRVAAGRSAMELAKRSDEIQSGHSTPPGFPSTPPRPLSPAIKAKAAATPPPLMRKPTTESLLSERYGAPPPPVRKATTEPLLAEQESTEKGSFERSAMLLAERLNGVAPGGSPGSNPPTPPRPLSPAVKAKGAATPPPLMRKPTTESLLSDKSSEKIAIGQSAMHLAARLNGVASGDSSANNPPTPPRPLSPAIKGKATATPPLLMRKPTTESLLSDETMGQLAIKSGGVAVGQAVPAGSPPTPPRPPRSHVTKAMPAQAPPPLMRKPTTVDAVQSVTPPPLARKPTTDALLSEELASTIARKLTTDSAPTPQPPPLARKPTTDALLPDRSTPSTAPPLVRKPTTESLPSERPVPPPPPRKPSSQTLPDHGPSPAPTLPSRGPIVRPESIDPLSKPVEKRPVPSVPPSNRQPAANAAAAAWACHRDPVPMAVPPDDGPSPGPTLPSRAPVVRPESIDPPSKPVEKRPVSSVPPSNRQPAAVTAAAAAWAYDQDPVPKTVTGPPMPARPTASAGASGNVGAPATGGAPSLPARPKAVGMAPSTPPRTPPRPTASRLAAGGD